MRVTMVGRESAPEIPKPAADPPRIPEAPAAPAIPAPALTAEAAPERGAVLPGTAEKLPAEPPPEVALKQGRFVSIVAQLNLTKNTGKIVHVNQVGRALVSTVAQNDRAVIRILNRAGRVIAEHRVWVREDTDIPPDEDRTAVIDAVIPYEPAAARVQLFLSGKEIDEIRISPNAPRIGQMRLSRLSQGTTTEQKAQETYGGFVLEWDATDADGDKLTYIVQSSTDKGKTWLTLAVGLSEPRLTLSADQFDPRRPPLLRVIASDGWNSSAPKQLAGSSAR